jgi:hypothetical protein
VAYSGEAAPQAVAEQLNLLPGVHRLTTAVATAEKQSSAARGRSGPGAAPKPPRRARTGFSRRRRVYRMNDGRLRRQAADGRVFAFVAAQAFKIVVGTAGGHWN